MARSKSRKNHTSLHKAQYVLEYKESGLSVREFCKDRNLVRQTFYSWLNLSKVKANKPLMAPTKKFLPIMVTEEVTSKAIYAEVSYPDGKVVRFYQAVDAVEISLLLKAN